MYCTGGVRCERANGLVRQIMDADVKDVFQLQGMLRIHRYCEEFRSVNYR